MYKHIKRDDRICIALMLKQSYTHTKIGKELGFHRTTISREIKRNRDETKIYKVSFADKRAKIKRKLSKKEYRIIDNDLIKKRKIKKYLKKDWSPEQIAKTLRLNPHTTIYRYIDRFPELKKYLRRQGRQRRKYGTKANLSRYQANKRTIHERPVYDYTKGHWEGDTIVGKERKLKTITYDNGSEFALHKMIERDTKALVCFADKGKPQQRGSNENINGLLRQYFPKGSPFATITNKDVQRAVYRLNSRPRKRLNYLTPRQVFKGVHFKS